MAKRSVKKRKFPFRHKQNGLIRANPDPIFLSDFAIFGSTKLSWVSIGTDQIEIHVFAPNGPLVCKGGPSGCIFVKRVRNGMVFFLQDTSNGLPLTEENTLDSVTVHVLNTRFTAGIPMRLPTEFYLSYSARNAKGKVLVAL